ncbi:MAG: uroporphyrinogen-III synthase, partial [Nitrososphaerales archaeon]|nr:uroporphyrinogen-III synthase [Nitrososphaerales archaeon]
IKVIPIVRVCIDHNEIMLARKIFQSKFKPDLSIFTSKTAVKVVFDLISEAWECARSYSIAIGFGTASLLKSLGVRSVDLPNTHNSEGLIQLLKGLSYKSIVVLYCSKNVNPILEGFIKDKFENSHIFKLYSVEESMEGLERMIKLFKSDNSQTYLLILTSIKIVQTLSKALDHVQLNNVIFSALSKRIANEAERLGFHIPHLSDTGRIDDYYESLRGFIKSLTHLS